MSGSLPQLQTFQLPDVGGVVNALQGLELNRMRSQQLQGAEQERNALRQYLSDPNVDIMSPETSRRVLSIAPTIGGPALNAATAARREAMQAQTAALDNSLKQHTVLRQQIPGIMLLPETDRQGAWGRYLEQLYAVFPQYRGQISPTYSDDVARQAMDAADKIAERIAQQRIELEGSTAIFDPLRRELTFPREGAAPGAAPPAAAPMATPMSAPAAPGAAAGDTIPLSAPATGAAPVPTSRSTDISTILPAIDRGEGRGANPASSARGQFQFIDPTFIDEFKRNFPDIARGMSNSQILSYRNSTLPDGRPIEEFLGEAHTNRNAATLSRAGFEPNGANLYLAHFAGIGGARSLLSADPNASVESVLGAQAVNANPFLKGKTVGQILQWAGDTVDYGPGAARRRLLAMGAPDNRVEPGAALTSPVLQTPLTNAMTATPVSNAFVKPSTGGGMKADAFLDDATLASNPLAMPVSDVRPAAPGLPRSIAEAREMRLQREEEQARARQRGQETAKSEKEREDNIRNIDSALDIINRVIRVDPNTGTSTLGRATGSGVGAARDFALGQVGISTDASKAAADLETAHARIVSMLPKFKGDLSKVEFDSLQAQAARLGDRSRPNAERASALRALQTDLLAARERLSGQRGSAGGASTAPAAPAEGGWSIRPVQ